MRATSTTPARRPEPPAHGLIGYVLADDQRTRNALLLLRPTLGGAVLAAAVAILAVHSPGEAWVYGGASGLAASGVAWYGGRRRARRRTRG
ncbi:hypothetical protein LZG04_21175 [Saccharothrix sp. S26]|uniref:hypothetical protein n=1 Tax=Saccharothrix sp. S26 TaxID=2907215 RepID=UPI001F23078A|nr:hypothetical protein [Saccharothrix sp. S26]MCE6997296.1 hypothetical protein [Saccharothrix sp. S26]